jgi:iron(III) transport system ATP-binding protein
VGSPDELYNRPVDAGAAAFFSDHSAVEGTVQSGAVSTALGRFAAPRLAEGVLAQALIRPEAVEIVGAGGTAARVVRWRLIGASGLAELEAQSVALMARTAAHPALMPGDTVQIRVIPERVLVFAKAQP